MGVEDGGPPPPRGGVVPWAVLTALVPVVFAIVVVALNASVYSAGGFVSRYLDALERRDVAVALETPGVAVPVGASEAALQRDALSGLGRHRIVSDVNAGSGLRRVVAEYELGGHPERTEFLVAAAPPTLLLFNGWRFEESPLARVRVTVLHDTGLRVNGVPVPDGTPTTGGDGTVDLAVPTPSRLVLDQRSRYLVAKPTTVDVTDPAAGAEATIDVQASGAFTSAVQKEVDAFLDDCATQRVLQPAGCPFRRVLADRVQDEPQWSIVSYPDITIQPGVGDDGEFAWFVTPSSGVAHISVDVVSLFDGSVSTLDEDVAYEVRYAITVRDDGGLDIRGI
ncbi:hypothetical protein [Naasia aerilata]|uniref:Uncharacterized protein n=1 Tax=Naasia aerilata TaxID=1162966 RepID=A0ABN6XNE4_9MICO|nr:hypothetical protein [Naasia aerilata]BDZ45332.1 hypothetical protein GCM10025866_12410 [Naasia aerilata]